MNPEENPMQHPEEQLADSSSTLHIGRLLAILLLAVILIALLATGAQSYFT